MADSSGIRAGRAFVELGVSDKLTKGLANAIRQLKAFGEGLKSIGKQMMAIGGGVLGAMLHATKTFSEGTHELLEMSERTGISVEALSELSFAASQSGVDLEGLEKSLRKMERTVGEAAMGSSSAAEALGRLGLSAGQLRTLKPDEQFAAIADGVSKIEDPTLRAAVAMQIFGKSGTEMLPLMQDGAAGITALRDEARSLGLTVSTQTAQQAAVLHDALNALWRVLRKLYTTIGSALAPEITSLARGATRIVVSVTAWVKANKALLVTAAKTAAAVFGIGAALFVAGTAIIKTIAIFGAIKAAFAGVSAFLSAVGSILVGLLSPIGLVVVGLAGLGAVFLAVSGVGGQALNWLGNQFKSLWDTVLTVVGGIVDALSAGDVALAAKIMWLGLKQAWDRGVAALNRTWLEAKRFFLGVVYDMWYGALAAAETVFHGLEVAWIETTAFLSKTWTQFTAGFQKTWNTAINWTTKRLLELMSMFDDSFDLTAAKKMADEQLAAENTELDRQKDASLKDRERQRQTQRDQSGQEHDAAMAEIGKQDLQASRQLDDTTNAKIADTQKQLDDARRELNDALAKAKNERRQADARPEGHALRNPLEDVATDIGARMQVLGSFNAENAYGLGSSAQERTAKATEETARNTGKLASGMGKGLVFG